MVGIMEKLDSVLSKWNDQERDRKEKGTSSNSPEPTMSFDAPNITQELRGGTWERVSREECGRVENKSRRLDMSIFNGEALDAWVLRAERYFSINQFTNWEKIEGAAVCFEGEALTWYQWENGRQPLTRWEDLKLLLLQRFRPSQEGSVLEKFLALRQEGTVKDYRRWFELLAAPLPELP